ncbi:UDP-glucose--hexose-1-phosphate uridylyltransferase [Niameybacter massiliensis]|uniref:UDP-glucose--hexose-1-phosphate uridylyltransferase n=1 Tax=Niameybacter massiliensis TaxID=1658108 RepID=UPI0006B5B784|nr:UDP-glucose--hexose-1-phosphate uridylyltransferase [Niameybacter massiliensis]
MEKNLTKKLCGFIDRLIELNIENHLIEEMDAIYIRNRVLALFKEDYYEVSEKVETNQYETLDALLEIALEKELIEEHMAAKDQFVSHLMDLFLDKPSGVNRKFFELYKNDVKAATDYFYELSQLSTYIKVRQLAKNKQFNVDSPYGEIQITINLSKPEKDPKQIALERLAPSSNYPTCLLCQENEGYEGTIKHPDRANHRMIRLELNNKKWLMQYSPYLYYNEHCIILSDTHTPMQITASTFNNLLDFTTQFPHYFIGSNADLPIVGGSILSHEHYQGGRHTFPMDEATTLFEFTLPKYKSIQGKVVNWPLSTIELVGESTEELAKCSDEILKLWRAYSDPICDILAYTEDTPHNTITPICKREGSKYVMRLVLRNNRTTDEHPLGIFHPHQDVQHIKKENIGLIEVMGLAILPGRLLTELEEVKKYVRGEVADVAENHMLWADGLKATYNEAMDIEQYIKQALGDKFVRVLEDAGVYKLNEEGIAGFKRFIETFGSLAE